MKPIAVLAALGAVLVALGAGWWAIPAVGLVVGGVEMIAGSYVAAYLLVKVNGGAADETARRPRT